MSSTIRRRAAQPHHVVAIAFLAALSVLLGCGAEPPTAPGALRTLAPLPMAATSLSCGLNQPLGFRTITVGSLAVKNALGTGAVLLGPWQRAMGVAMDPSRGAVAEFTYAKGMTGGRAPGEMWLNEAALKAQSLKDLYVCLWVKPATNFGGHASGVNKLAFLGFGKYGNQAIVMLYGVGAGSLSARVSGQGTSGIPANASSSATCGSSGCSWMGPVGPVIGRGVWSMIEVVAHSGPAGGKSSWIEGYANGQSIGRISGIDFLWPKANGTNPRAEKIALSPTWGGTGGVVSNSFTLRASGLLVSGK